MPPTPHRHPTVLVIEDDVQIRRALKRFFEPELRVLEAGTAREGIDLAAAQRPEIIVLDLGLPDARGIEVCREIRAWSNTPIVALSARHSEADKVELVEAGTDDFVTKPFSPIELTARLHACLRRAAQVPSQPPAQPIPIGDMVLDLDARTLKRQGRAVHLTPIEWELLRTLVTHAGRTLTHNQLLGARLGKELGGEEPAAPAGSPFELAAQDREQRPAPAAHLHRARRRLPLRDADLTATRRARTVAAHRPGGVLLANSAVKAGLLEVLAQGPGSLRVVRAGYPASKGK